MDGFTQVTLLGSVGKDAETKIIGDNSQKATFSVATNRTYKKNGEKVTETEWHNIEVWGEVAKFAGTYVKKGSLILVVGDLRYDKYEDKETKKQVVRAKIVANKIQLLPKSSGTTASAESANANVATAAKQTEEFANTVTSESFSSGADDDLPF